MRRQLQEQREAASLEAARLRQQLRRAEARANAPPCRDEVVEKLAEMECEPLRRSPAESRVVLRKRLLLKWHPDKQPSPESVELATQVMLALQNRDEWSW